MLRHDGVPNAQPQFTLFNDDRPLPIAEIVDEWQTANRIYDEDPDRAEFEGDEFRSWDRRWLPVTRDCAGCLWVYDLRPGPRHGTFVRVDHDTGIDFDATRPSLAALLDQVATTLETGIAPDGSRPEVDETGELFW
jgi:cell wall assembly regulator SMI1